MFKVSIDFSVFTKEAAFGRVSGSLVLPALPQIGDAIAFRVSRKIDAYLDLLPFGGSMRVTHRIIPANADAEILLVLEDVTAATGDDARQLVAMMEEDYRLAAEVWED